jgi:hypothetical protein
MRDFICQRRAIRVFSGAKVATMQFKFSYEVLCT